MEFLFKHKAFSIESQMLGGHKDNRLTTNIGL